MIDFVTIRTPLALTLPKDSYAARHANVNLNTDQSERAKMLVEGLRETHATLESGRHVETIADAIRWMFENVAKAPPSAPAPAAPNPFSNVR